MNKTEYGFRNVWYAPIESEEDNTFTYGTPKSFLAEGCGGIGVNLAPVGESSELHADDVVWEEDENNQGYDGDLTLTKVSKDFKKDIMGMTEDLNGALTEHADAKFKKFALGFEVQGNEKPKRTWYLNCSCGRFADEHGTNETSKTYSQPAISLKARPRPYDKKVKSSLTLSETNQTAYENFFNAVYEEVTTTV